jgi:hypothetical protein
MNASNPVTTVRTFVCRLPQPTHTVAQHVSPSWIISIIHEQDPRTIRADAGGGNLVGDTDNAFTVTAGSRAIVGFDTDGPFRVTADEPPPP